MFKALGLDEHDYKFGMTKVFFRPGKFSVSEMKFFFNFSFVYSICLCFKEFDQLLRSDPENLKVLISKVRKWLLRTRWKKAQYGAWSVIKLKNKILYRRKKLILIQSAVRGWLARRKYRHR